MGIFRFQVQNCLARGSKAAETSETTLRLVTDSHPETEEPVYPVAEIALTEVTAELAEETIESLMRHEANSVAVFAIAQSFSVTSHGWRRTPTARIVRDWLFVPPIVRANPGVGPMADKFGSLPLPTEFAG